MSVIDQYRTSGTSRMGATIVLEDGLVFEGIVENELAQGIYLSIGGDLTRLSMFPWGRVTRVSYKLPE